MATPGAWNRGIRSSFIVLGPLISPYPACGSQIGTQTDYRCAVTPTSGSADRLRDELVVKPGSSVRLSAIDPDATHGHRKSTARPKIEADLERLRSVQERIWAEHRHRVLIVLQGIDTAGKDGAIKHAMSGFHPLGCRVWSFGVPTIPELAHDYLWRIHQVVPGNGEIAIFNRSHYESVLVERVHQLVPEATWSRPYDQINAFEAMLADEGTTILKFFLHIDRDEQLARLKARLEDPTKRWKFNVGDLGERKLWDAYMTAYEDALSRCSAQQAPWYVIPANHKWFRDLAIGEILADTLEALHPAYPTRDDIPADLVVE
jgi:PPK2 family polyphosphate:nucleotide phosphotransferase